jgi:hypothetical protein
MIDYADLFTGLALVVAGFAAIIGFLKIVGLLISKD